MSEKILPTGGWFETGAMIRGEPGIPAGFTFRGREFRVLEKRESGKETQKGYVRRHTFVLLMDDGSIWSIYCPRQPPFGWYLRSVVRPKAGEEE